MDPFKHRWDQADRDQGMLYGTYQSLENKVGLSMPTMVRSVRVIWIKQVWLVKNRDHGVAIGSDRTIAKCVMFVVAPQWKL